MEFNIFTFLILPDFVDVTINEKTVVSSRILYSPAKMIFKKVLFNFLRDERQKKLFRSKSCYTNFLRDYCKKQKLTKALKHAKNEWENLDEETKDLYRTIPSEKIETKPKRLKSIKKPKTTRCSFSIFVAVKSMTKNRTYEYLASKWKDLSEEKKQPYADLCKIDKERADFEKIVFNRLELVLRLLGACSIKPLIKKQRGFSVFKDELKASLIERGFTKVPNIEILARNKYGRMDKESKVKYKSIANAKNEEIIEQVFMRVLKKANIDYKDLIGFGPVQGPMNVAFDEDYDEFIMAEDTNF